jgi:hypothetical protein
MGGSCASLTLGPEYISGGNASQGLKERPSRPYHTAEIDAEIAGLKKRLGKSS